jgi:hypothetical protein
MKKAPHEEGLGLLNTNFTDSGYSWPLLSQRFSMRALKVERVPVFFELRAFGEKPEIALITPPKAMRNPRIPIGVTLETRPPNKVERPSRTRPPATKMRFRAGETGAADRAETRRGSSVKRAASISSSKRFSRSESGTGSQ